MKKFFFLLIATVCLVGSGMAQKKVAVYVTGEITPAYKKVIGSKMVSAITRSDGYSAVERTADFLAAMTEETGYQASGAVSDNQIAKLGQQFGVRYVAVIDATELFEEVFLAARLIDVQTAKIAMSVDDNKAIQSMTDLVTISESVATKLIGDLDMIDFVNADGNIKALGPFSSARELGKVTAPEGYRMATEAELTNLFKVSKQFRFPIYLNITTTKTYESTSREVAYYDG